MFLLCLISTTAYADQNLTKEFDEAKQIAEKLNNSAIHSPHKKHSRTKTKQEKKLTAPEHIIPTVMPTLPAPRSKPKKTKPHSNIVSSAPHTQKHGTTNVTKPHTVSKSATPLIVPTPTSPNNKKP